MPPGGRPPFPPHHRRVEPSERKEFRVARGAAPPLPVEWSHHRSFLPSLRGVSMPFHTKTPMRPGGRVIVPEALPSANAKSTEMSPFGEGIAARMNFRGPGCGAMRTRAKPSASGRMPAMPVCRWKSGCAPQAWQSLRPRRRCFHAPSSCPDRSRSHTSGTARMPPATPSCPSSAACRRRPRPRGRTRRARSSGSRADRSSRGGKRRPPARVRPPTDPGSRRTGNTSVRGSPCAARAR